MWALRGQKEPEIHLFTPQPATLCHVRGAPIISQSPCDRPGLHLENEVPNTILGEASLTDTPQHPSYCLGKWVACSTAVKKEKKLWKLEKGLFWRNCVEGVWWGEEGHSAPWSVRREHSDWFWIFPLATPFRIPLSPSKPWFVTPTVDTHCFFVPSLTVKSQVFQTVGNPVDHRVWCPCFKHEEARVQTS